MNLSLTTLKERLKNARFLIVAVLIMLALLALLFFQQVQRRQNKPQSDIPLSAKKQPVINGKFDEKALVSQQSKKSIESLKNFLPYTKTITTSTGQQVTLTAFSKQSLPYTLYVEIQNVNFQSTYPDPELPKNVQDFRDTANDLISFLKLHNINPGSVFISWGSLAFIQDSAEAWLVESPSYPKVINQNGKFVFETAPVH